MKKFFGWSMIASLFVGMFIFFTMHTSFLVAVKTFATAGGAIGFIYMAVYLIHSED